MIMVDTALQKRQEAGNPVRVAIVGAGAMGRGMTNTILNGIPGMEVVAIANRTLANAHRAYTEAGVEEIREVQTVTQLEDAIAQNQYAITDDPLLVAQADGIEAIVEVTGTIDYAAKVVLEAINHHKHVILMNAELDGTLGPILKVYADRAGVILSACDGDQPGVQMNLYRFVKSIGLTPLVCGNIKGLLDPYRTPETQAPFAHQWGLSVQMATHFADGTKVMFEQAIVANGTGMKAAKRGLLGYNHPGHVDQMTGLYDIEQLKSLGGIVDYALGSQPGPGVYVFGTIDDPKHRKYLHLLKMGEGPLYSFYVPYHLCYFEVPISIARVVLLGDVVLAPLAGQVVDVVTIAKRDLKAGETIDEIGGFMTYGLCENSDVTQAENLLPIGLAEGCRLKRDIPKDGAIAYSDVEVPEGRLGDKLRAEQNAYFAAAKPLVTA
ncbi:MAG TPA: SAF domain-containing protein [Thermosynechococcaceae cyanobacterium]